MNIQANLSVRVFLLISCFLVCSGCGGNKSTTSSGSSSSSSSSTSASSSNSSSSGEPAILGDLVLALNVGSHLPVTVDQLSYQGEQFIWGGKIQKTQHSVAGAPVPDLYQTSREGYFDFEIPLTNGVYHLQFQFNETVANQVGERIFDILVQNQVVEDDLDIFAEAGANTAFNLTVKDIIVFDGRLTIELGKTSNNATLSGLSVYTEFNGEFIDPFPPDGTVSGGIAGGLSKYVGNIFTSNSPIPGDFNQYWNQVALENGGKWESVEYKRGAMDWARIDEAYKYARHHGIVFKHRNFVWNSQFPAWVNSLLSGVDEELEDFIRQYCERFPDTRIIDVVNEPLFAPPSYYEAIGGDGESGWDWVIWSFEKAREHCPTQTLIINAYDIFNNQDKINQYKALVELLKPMGLIDGLGVMAVGKNIQPLGAAEIKRDLDSLAQTGIPIYITEMDIEDSETVDQLAKYQEIFPIMYEHPAVVGITLFGYRDGQSFRGEIDLLNGDTPKPALEWLTQYLRVIRDAIYLY